MPIFKPTYLYIKKHRITGKLYFGKTIQNPERYIGSGLHWKSHINKHGRQHVETLWYCLFLDQESLTEFALTFSRQQNIVESDEWLNMIDENGVGGYSRTGAKNTDSQIEQCRKMGILFGNKKKSDTHKNNIRMSMIGKVKDEETRKKISNSKKGVPLSQLKCPHCGKIGGSSNMKRYHFENCKDKYCNSAMKD